MPRESNAEARREHHLTAGVYRFGPFILDRAAYRLLRDGVEAMVHMARGRLADAAAGLERGVTIQRSDRLATRAS